MWLVCGGGEVVEAMYQLMWKYKVSQWNVCLSKEAHMAVQCPAFAFVKAKGSLCGPHKKPKWCTQSPS